MESSTDKARAKIEKRYSKLIAKALRDLKDSTMGEFWKVMDSLKKQMANDFKKAGIELGEDKRDNMDA